MSKVQEEESCSQSDENELLAKKNFVKEMHSESQSPTIHNQGYELNNLKPVVLRQREKSADDETQSIDALN